MELIEKQAAIDAILGQPPEPHYPSWYAEQIKQLPPAQPEQHYDEWCYSCKEYDKEKHSCPRWNKVIKNTVDELKSAQPEPCDDAVNREEVLNCIEWQYPDKTPRTKIMELPPVTPKQRTGKWIKKHRHYGGFRSYTGFDSMGEQHTITVDERAEYDDLYCSECGARSADNFLNFCPNCGADMRGEQE